MTLTHVVWLPTRPDFAIRHLRGTSTSRGYHESFFEVVSRVELDADDLRRLDACGLLGMGQAYDLMKSEVITDTVPPVSVDRLTGEPLPDVPPMNYAFQPITQTFDYEYHRYEIRRICDSGD